MRTLWILLGVVLVCVALTSGRTIKEEGGHKDDASDPSQTDPKGKPVKVKRVPTGSRHRAGKVG